MNATSAVRAALRAAGLCEDVRSTRDLAGGCIHRVMELELVDKTLVLAKINRATMLALLQEEVRSLEALAATRTIPVPQPLAAVCTDGHAVLLMSHIQSATADAAAWTAFGRDLAALHIAPAGARYGFETDNHIGSTFQPNAWMNDWIEFNAVNRLGFQLELACEHGRLVPSEAMRIEGVIANLDRHIPRTPRPSLLHGDLWSGNALPTRDRIGDPAVAVIDPACSVGHGLADIAMMQLFGGIGSECYRLYEEATGIRLDDRESRAALAVYQLYHVLNHVNLFGRSYASQAMALVKQLGM